jgi:hypothetical protein
VGLFDHPNLWNLIFPIIAGVTIYFIGVFSRNIYDWFKPIRVYAEIFQFKKLSPNPSGELVETDLQNAVYFQLFMKLNFFNTKGKLIGLHRIKMEFIRKGIFRKLLYREDVKLNDVDMNYHTTID